MLDLPIIVLCGGLGSRLQSVVSDRPKALALVCGRPFLTMQLELLRERGARRFVLCVGHMAEQIEAVYGNGSAFGVHIDYSRDGVTQLGTGGALKRAEHHFAPAAIVVNGDTHIDVDLQELVRVHCSARVRGAVATLTLARMPDAHRYGRIDFEGNRVTAFREKLRTVRPKEWVNAGVYVIERDLLARIPPGEAVSLERDVFPSAFRDGLPITAFPQSEPFHDIGTPDDFRAFADKQEGNYAA